MVIRMLYIEENKITLKYNKEFYDKHGSMLYRVFQEGQLTDRMTVVLLIGDDFEACDIEYI